MPRLANIFPLLCWQAPDQDSAQPARVATQGSVNSRNACFYGASLALLQFMDAFGTMHGVNTWGLQAEGNILIFQAMLNFGPFYALVLSKSLALILIAALCLRAVKKAWIADALLVLNIFYLSFAVLPWSFLFWRCGN